MRIAFIGRQGSGKGTHGSRLAKMLALDHIVISEMLSARAWLGDQLGQRINSCMERGELVDDFVVSQVLAERLAAEGALSGFVLDGFPRKDGQAQTLRTMLKALRTPAQLDAVVHLDISREVAEARLLNRLMCESCGLATNLDEAQGGSKCPNCESDDLRPRKDDRRQSSVARRLDTFDAETAPLLNFYRAHGQLIEIDAEREPSKVFKTITELLNLEHPPGDAQPLQ